MNTHDNIELPAGITDHKIVGHDGPVYTDVQVRELIEADRKQRGEPTQSEAVYAFAAWLTQPENTP